MGNDRGLDTAGAGQKDPATAARHRMDAAPSALGALRRLAACGWAKRWLRDAGDWAFCRKTALVFQRRDLTTMAGGLTADLPPGYLLREVCDDELPRCARLIGVAPEQYRRRRQQGERCFAVFRHRRPVHLNWLHFGSCYVCGLGLSIEAQASSCYVYNVFTDPQERGKGLYKVTQRMLIEILAARHVAHIIQVVLHTNDVPAATLPKLGYHLTHVVRHTTLCGLKVTSIGDAAGHSTATRVFWRRPANLYPI